MFLLPEKMKEQTSLFMISSHHKFYKIHECEIKSLIKRNILQRLAYANDLQLIDVF
jgi:hypothetical protein